MSRPVEITVHHSVVLRLIFTGLAGNSYVGTPAKPSKILLFPVSEGWNLPEKDGDVDMKWSI